ncbi:hypothetical protein EST38_g13537 [Candolleomyces aberdarensis]|uniref:Uncharacterized protein n=1 Tax=Candolleomyces aberdarensis TaxID=2316362 RepID=A0A4Q2D1I2_9AGAR|nr:hypothetical protein EST38_g13537 [Candolleomyces aberdarensis]
MLPTLKVVDMYIQTTFTGGVQAAVLSLMNDLLSGESLNVELFPPDSSKRSGKNYSTFSLGLMLGLLAIALNLTVAAIAAVNAALACHFTLNKPTNYNPTMEARITLCMLIQFMASGVSGISLILLCLNLDKPFMIVTSILFFAGIVISTYHLVALFAGEYITALKKQPLHVVSLLISTAAFGFDVSTPSPSSWFTITTYGFTMIYHMLAVLHNRTQREDTSPRRVYIVAVLLITGCWAGCVAVTTTLRERHGQWENACRYVVLSLASAETAILLAIGIWDLFKRVGNKTNPKTAGQ